jgi:hypothetical protein
MGAAARVGGIISQPFSVLPGATSRVALSVENDGRLRISVPGMSR